MRAAALRFIACIVLLCGLADYLAFDVGDPLAPMSAAGTTAFLCPNPHLSPPAILPADSHDDGCIGCAAGFTARQVTVLVAEAVAPTNTWYSRPPSGPPPTRFDRPPRS